LLQGVGGSIRAAELWGFSTGGTLEFPLLAPAVQHPLWKSPLLLTAGSGELWPAQEEQQAARKAAQDSLLTARHGFVGLGLPR